MSSFFIGCLAAGPDGTATLEEGAHALVGSLGLHRAVEIELFRLVEGTLEVEPGGLQHRPPSQRQDRRAVRGKDVDQLLHARIELRLTHKLRNSPKPSNCSAGRG